MLRDQAEETMDMEVLEEAEIEDLNPDSIRGYCNSHKSFKPGHPFFLCLPPPSSLDPVQ